MIRTGLVLGKLSYTDITQGIMLEYIRVLDYALNPKP